MDDLHLRSVHRLPLAEIRHRARQRADFAEYVERPWLQLRRRGRLVAVLSLLLAVSIVANLLQLAAAGRCL